MKKIDFRKYLLEKIIENLFVGEETGHKLYYLRIRIPVRLTTVILLEREKESVQLAVESFH